VPIALFFLFALPLVIADTLSVFNKQTLNRIPSEHVHRAIEWIKIILKHWENTINYRFCGDSLFIANVGRTNGPGLTKEIDLIGAGTEYLTGDMAGIIGE
tara:strand:+ start:624 stop:923 length:300 start_codon:yes stop_codon:yes gene_type:complete